MQNCFVFLCFSSRSFRSSARATLIRVIEHNAQNDEKMCWSKEVDRTFGKSVASLASLTPLASAASMASMPSIVSMA